MIVNKKKKDLKRRQITDVKGEYKFELLSQTLLILLEKYD